MTEPAVRISGLQTRAQSGTEILRGVDWSVDAASVAIVVGPSGSGKSRLLRVLNRLDEPAAGSVEVLGKALDDWSVGELRRAVGWVPQRPAIAAGTAGAAIELLVRLNLVTARELADRLPRALATARLDESVLDRDAAAISGGERHRVALARALVLEPRILLLDEPSAALDGATAAAVLEALAAWADERGATLIVATHRIEDVNTLGGDMLVLDGGVVVRAGPSRELLADSADYDVHHLLTGREDDS